MKFIKTFEELKNIPNSTKVHKFQKGNVDTFIVVGTIIQSNGLIVANNNSLKDVRFIYETDFKENQYTTAYDTKEAGELMIQQIKDWADKEIEDISAVYLKNK